DIWKKFDRKCFNCTADLESAKKMHLDHTRPLALLWPLDGTATALCGTCNSSKRDRSPVDFYTSDQLVALADLTGLSIDELKSPAPNVEALDLLLNQRWDWFFGDFLARPEMRKE